MEDAFGFSHLGRCGPADPTLAISNKVWITPYGFTFAYNDEKDIFIEDHIKKADKYLPSVRDGVATNKTDPALSPRGYWTKLANWLARSRPTLYEFSVQEVRKWFLYFA